MDNKQLMFEKGGIILFVLGFKGTNTPQKCKPLNHENIHKIILLFFLWCILFILLRSMDKKQLMFEKGGIILFVLGFKVTKTPQNAIRTMKKSTK